MHRSLLPFQIRTSIVLGIVIAVLAGATYAVLVGSGSAKAEANSASSGQVPSTVRDSGAAASLLDTVPSRNGIEIVSDAMRTVPAPSSAGANAAPWATVPTADGGTCGSTSRLVFCGADDASVEAGRASVTEYPRDTNPRRDASGRWTVTPSDGTGTRSGAAPKRATQVVVIDKDGQAIRREAVDHGVYEITVPPQGSGSQVEFQDPDGKAVASRPAEG